MKFKGREKEYRKEYYKEWFAKIRQERIDYLGGQCVKCGSVEKLEFDHIDPSLKEFDISAVCYSIENIIDELNKCQLLCEDCHLEKTKEDSMTKYCTHGHEMTEENTYWAVRKSGRRDRRCKECRKVHKQRYLTKKKRVARATTLVSLGTNKNPELIF